MFRLNSQGGFRRRRDDNLSQKGSLMKHALLGACALAFAFSVSGCNNAITNTNNVLANLVGGANAGTVQAACTVIGVAEGYFANVKMNVTANEAAAEAAAEAVVKNLCATPPTNLTTLFSDLLSAWTVIQAATTLPTPTNPNPSVPTLVTN
jgi:hypothetical protein